MYTPEQENKIRRAAQQDRIRGAEALFRNRKKPDIDVGAAVKRAVTGAVQSTDWSQSRLHPGQFGSTPSRTPLTDRLQRAGKGEQPTGGISHLGRRQVQRVPSKVKKPVKPREVIL